jgi:hypothetical protein
MAYRCWSWVGKTSLARFPYVYPASVNTRVPLPLASLAPVKHGPMAFRCKRPVNPCFAG